MSTEVYDYIVVGAGSSGCVLAAELCADPSLRVLVLEAGDSAEEHPETLLAARYKHAFVSERLMWDRQSSPQAGCDNAVVSLGSGKVVGGSGGVNAMVYTRGDARDYDAWDLDGWRWAEVVKDFARIEERLRLHRLPPTAFTEACITAAEGAGFARKEDLNDGALGGFIGYEWMNIDGADRRSSYAAFLRPLLGRENLHLRTGVTARRVLLDGDRRAIGVEYGEGGRLLRAEARREVILCAGALETPKLLMLSGIGPAGELARHGVPLVLARDGVGGNLHDHPNVGVFFLGTGPTDCEWAQLYAFHRALPQADLAPGQADTCYVFYSARSSFREGAMRLLPLRILPLFLYRVGWLRRLLRGVIGWAFNLGPVRRFIERMYGIIVILGKPRSRGRLRLRSARAEDMAVIDPGYLSAPEDLEALVRGVELARRVAAAAGLKEWGNRELLPGRRTRSQRQLEGYVKGNLITTYHYAGTCRMGQDEASVVDPQLRVRGVTGLRVADASVIPAVPVSAMNAPSMLIGYRAARLLREAARRGQSPHAGPESPPPVL